LASLTNPISGITTTVANTSRRLPYLGYSPGGMADAQTTGDGKFNSLQAAVRKQLSRGLQRQAAYTFSRSLSTVACATFNDPNIHSAQYGLNSAYRPQRLAINHSWDLSLGGHQGLLAKVANGWNVAGDHQLVGESAPDSIYPEICVLGVERTAMDRWAAPVFGIASL
jgi:hypothetical protein